MEQDIDNYNIFEVAKSGSLGVLKISLENFDIYNFHIDTQDEDGNTLLHIVAGKSSSLSTKILELGANPNIQNKLKEIPLHISCTQGKLNVTKTLIQHHSRTDICNKHGETPIFNAVKCNRLTTVKYFKNNNLITETGNNCLDQNLLHVATNTENLNLIKLLAESYDLNKACSSGDSVIIQAVKLNNRELVGFFLERGANINQKDAKLRNLLHLSIQHGSGEISEILIKRGIDINSQDSNGEAPLHYAVRSNNKEILNMLLFNRDIDVNVRDFDEYTPLHLSVFCKNCEFARILLRHKADPAMKTFNGDSALHLACSVGSLDCALLFDISGNSRLNNHGLNPEQLAHMNGHERLVRDERICQVGQTKIATRAVPSH